MQILKIYPRALRNIHDMPVVTITMAKGRTYEQKKQMAEEIAGTIARVVGVPWSG